MGVPSGSKLFVEDQGVGNQQHDAHSPCPRKRRSGCRGQSKQTFTPRTRRWTRHTHRRPNRGQRCTHAAAHTRLRRLGRLQLTHTTRSHTGRSLLHSSCRARARRRPRLGPAIRVEAIVIRLALLLAGSCRLGRARVRGLRRGRGSPRGEGVVCVVVEGREVRWSLAWSWWTLSCLLLLLLLKHHVMVPLRELGRVRVVESLRRHRWIAALPRIEAWRAGRPALGRRGRGGRAGRGRRRRLLVDGVRVRRVGGRLLAGRPGRRRAGLHRRRRRNRHGHRTV